MREGTGTDGLRRAATILVTLAIVLFVPLSAEAHANLTHAEPAADASVAAAPSEVRLWFSEEPEPALSKIQVFDAARGRVDEGPPTPVQGDALALVEKLRSDLPAGTYTVSWETTSAVDGHVARGSFAFGVGSISTGTVTTEPRGDADETPSWSTAILRGLNDVVFLVLFGLLLFEPAVLRRAFRPGALVPDSVTERANALAVRCRRLALALAALGVLVTCATIVDQTWRSTHQLGGSSFVLVVGTPLGRLLLARATVAQATFLLVLAAGRALGSPRRAGADGTNRAWLLLGVALTQLLLLGLTSHAGGVSAASAPLLVVEWLHLAMAGAWVGGLVALALAVAPEPRHRKARGSSLNRADFLYPVIGHFSRVALPTVGGLALTGLLLATARAGSLGDLAATAYGTALAIKMAIVASAVLLAVGHRFVLLPKLGRADRAAAAAGHTWFSRGLPTEALLGVAILGATGVLASLPPPAEGASADIVARDVAGLHVSLRVDPLVAGLTGVRVSLLRDGQPVTDAAKVELQLQPTDIDSGVAVLDLANAGGGVYAAQTRILGMSGLWHTEMLIRTVGENDRRTAFELAVRAPPASPPHPTPVPIVQSPPITSALPEAGDLTLGGNAGDTLVGLTLRPGRPGANELLVYVLPKEGERAAGNRLVEVRIDGKVVPLGQCAATCRTATADLRGGEAVQIQIGDDPAALADFRLPSLPAPRGDELYERMRARMRDVQTLRIDERLGPADPPVSASYLLRAPDRMSARSSGGEEAIWIGQTRFSRSGPAQPWQTSEMAAALKVPTFMWSGSAAQSIYLSGRELVDGVEMETLSFFELSGRTPTWFRLVVRPDGLVYRASMRGPRHFMDQRYDGFDQAIAIEPPVAP